VGKRTLVPLTPRRPVDTASRKLAESLLTQAGFGAVVDIRPLGTHSNAHYAVAARDGRRHILRRFKENAPPHTALVRLDRECWVYRQLALAGAPVTSSARNVEGARR
jgi:Ser/Thr protein kinase RdoA (MazF antagonist)